MARSKVKNAKLHAIYWLIAGIAFFFLYFLFKVAKGLILIGGGAMAVSIYMFSRADRVRDKAIKITCPACDKETLVVSKLDHCSKCRAKLIQRGSKYYLG